MTAIASAYDHQILIGLDNQDWSMAYVSFQTGDPEWGQNGLLQVTGKLILRWGWGIPESMNPRSSTGRVRFAKGQRVIVNVRKPGTSTWKRHPRGWGYISKPPTPANNARPTLELDLVCCLEMRRFPVPKGPLLTPGQAYSIPTESDPSPPATLPAPNAVLFRDWAIGQCLTKSGISNTVSTNVTKYPTSFPLILAEDNFVDLAGALAYGGICLLYQDNQGVVRSRSLAYNPTPIKTVRIGLDECNYESRQGSETPAEEINYNGTVNRWKDATGGGADPDNPGKFSYQTEMGPGGAVDPALGTNEIILRETRKADGASASSKFSLTIIREPLGLMNPSAFPKITTLGLSSQVLIQHFYTGSDGRLDRIETTKTEPFFKAASEYYSKLSQTNKLNYRDSLVSTLTVERYIYDDKGITRIVSIYTKEIAAAIVKDQTLDNPLDPKYSLSDVTSYREVRTGEWEKEQVIRMPAARSKPDLKYTGLDAQTKLTAKLALAPTGYSSESSNQGQQTPPATERAPLTLTTEPYQIQGTATFNEVSNPYQPRSRDYTLEQGVTGVAQLTELAQLTGATLIGRAQGAQIELPFDDDWVDNPEPLQSISVIEVERLPTGWRKNLLLYQVDSLEFVHEKNSAKVVAALIWQGTIEGSIVPYTEIPAEPTFSQAEVVAPYQSLSLDYQDTGAGSISVTSPPTDTPDTGAEIVIAPPETIIQIAYVGIGHGVESLIGPPQYTDTLLGFIGIGHGVRSNLVDPLTATIGIGHGVSSNLSDLITAAIGIGHGVESDVGRLIITEIGIGHGVDTASPIVALSGIGHGVDAILPIAVEAGIGHGTASDLIDFIIAELGIGHGVDSMLPIVVEAGIGHGVDALSSIISQAGTGHGVDAMLPIVAQIGVGHGAETNIILSALSGSVSQSSGSTVGTYANLTDNLSTTGAGTNSANPSWIQIDFGVPVTIQKFLIGSGTVTGFGSTNTYLNASKIQYSSNGGAGGTWTDWVSISGTSGTAPAQFLFSATAQSARYWRIVTTGTNFLGASEFQPIGVANSTYPVTYSYSSNGDTNGVFYGLGKTTFDNTYYSWSNPAILGGVTITASGISSGVTANLTDRAASTILTTSNVAGSWIQFDFGTGRGFRLTDYTLRGSTNTNQYPRNWKMQGSNNGGSGGTWTDLDIRSSDTTINAANAYGKWSVNQGNASSWQYIRILSTNTNSGGFNTIDLSDVELYGILS